VSYSLRFSDTALDDLSSIGVYLKEASGSARIADGLVEQLVMRCENLAALPGTLGRDRSELAPGMRSVAQGNYVIFFRYLGTALEVVTVLEGHRDIVAYFDDGTR
jgi:toxin ParE1/3/4